MSIAAALGVALAGQTSGSSSPTTKAYCELSASMRVSRAEGRCGAYTSRGFFLADTPAGRVVFHRGTNRGYQCGMWIFLASGDGLVVMTNSAKGEELCTAAYEAVCPEAAPRG
ncbi:MAG TPA: hypothetical protein DCM87_17665 [Planctomycetes bacterium]|nr:hypothetical protein [Planctomycetota bacterium]